MRLILTTLLLVLGLNTANAQDKLAGSEVTHHGEFSAFLIGPTTRYRHGALGDDTEAAGFAVTFKGLTMRLLLPESQVFEDLRVRLQDFDGDDVPEAVIIRSDLAKGASIAVYKIAGKVIALHAESEFIGKPNRWLNIAGFGDFTGEGKILIAAVITPHLTGSLRVYRIDGSRLVEQARIDGFSNHVNGTTELDLAQLRDVNGDGIVDIVLPLLDHSAMSAVTFKSGQPQVLKP